MNVLHFKSGLFWKLTLALWVSMLLSMIAAGLYLRYTLGPPLQPPPGVITIGPLPLVPVVSGTLAMLIAGAAVAWYLAGPLQHLRGGLREVARGRFETRVTPLLRGRRDELTEVAEDFDRMAAQLEQLTKSRQVLLHDISHELRSPLARMQAAIGLLRQDASQTPAMLDRIERESNLLDALIEELLTLHRIEAAPEGWSMDTVDVMDLLHAVTEDADFEARALSREVCIDAPGEFVARVQAELLYRAFENVIRNAVKFTATGTVVEVRARRDNGGDHLVITVDDRGPGVPEESRERMFDPFVRLEGSETVRGVGLGLAMARRALEVNGGTIEASNRDQGGLRMTLRVPRSARP
ncbi:HAMP domain-containing sensor histidine kinase [Piscinibacter sp.]|uniref:HAMP domain-containing sensor histidine kinase n=1 Tax=Piscinibacter sp. TaxID=1903157 RepID=UPI002D80D61C|nr:ATP-binding protein [Albitalea sp.]